MTQNLLSKWYLRSYLPSLLSALHSPCAVQSLSYSTVTIFSCRKKKLSQLIAVGLPFLWEKMSKNHTFSDLISAIKTIAGFEKSPSCKWQSQEVTLSVCGILRLGLGTWQICRIWCKMDDYEYAKSLVLHVTCDVIYWWWNVHDSIWSSEPIWDCYKLFGDTGSPCFCTSQFYCCRPNGHITLLKPCDS